MRQKRATISIGIVVGALILCAIIFRVLGKIGTQGTLFGLARTVIYIGIYIAWGISVNRRIVQTPVRRCLLSVAGLMVFWFLVRSIKYYFVASPSLASRMMWYLYYLPMSFIPLASFYIAILLGKGEYDTLPRWARWLSVPTALCILLVLTNDLHQFVFSFPPDVMWSDKNNSYKIGYYIVIGWESLCALAAFGLMVQKCRLAQKKKYLPFLLLAGSILYALIYSSGVEWMRLIGGDITAGQCLMFSGILESCIQCGLIQTNTGYEQLFESGTIGAQITDGTFRTQFASSNAPLLGEERMREAESKPVYLNKDTLLKSSSIRGGHIFWQEDVRDITELLEQLEENQKTIAESNCIEEENYKTKIKINALREKNRLYARLQRQTTHQVDLLDALLTQCERETSLEIARSLLARVSVIGAYVKRRGNLIFIGEKSGATDTAELSACLEESFTGLQYMEVACAMDIPEGQKIPVAGAERVYDFFESTLEAALDDLRSIWMKGRIMEKELLFFMEVESGTDLSKLSVFADSCNWEDGVWRFTLRVGKAGDTI